MYTADFSFVEEDCNLLADIYLMESVHNDIITTDIKTNHLYSVTESEEILIEGFTDVMNKMGEYFKKMITAIKNFFKKILEFIKAHIMALDKYVKENKKYLESLSDLDYMVDGYEYTLDTKPNLKPFEDIVNGYNSDLANAASGKIDGDNVKAYINKQIETYMSSENLDKLRGEILGSKSPITSEDFNEEVRKFYRNGEDKSSSISIDTAKFAKYLDSVDDIVKLKKETEKERDSVIILLDRTEKFFNSKVQTVYKDKSRVINTKRVDISDNKFKAEDSGDDIKYSDTTMDNIDRFVRFKYNQVRAISGIINTVVSERANAAKEHVKFTRQVILGAMKNKKKEDKKDD